MVPNQDVKIKLESAKANVRLAYFQLDYAIKNHPLPSSKDASDLGVLKSDLGDVLNKLEKL